MEITVFGHMAPCKVIAGKERLGDRIFSKRLAAMHQTTRRHISENSLRIYRLINGSWQD
jgi:hypothetical protein